MLRKQNPWASIIVSVYTSCVDEKLKFDVLKDSPTYNLIQSSYTFGSGNLQWLLCIKYVSVHGLLALLHGCD